MRVWAFKFANPNLERNVHDTGRCTYLNLNHGQAVHASLCKLAASRVYVPDHWIQTLT